jgi:hypothetical protein
MRNGSSSFTSTGFLRGSFRPRDGLVSLRAYLRHRERLVDYAASHIQHMQKALTDFASVANRLEEFFGASIHSSCFITPPNSQGFTAHYDTYSFFAVQLYAHLSPAFLSAEVSLLDPPPPAPPTLPKGNKTKRARKGQSGPDGDSAETEVPDFVM